MCRLLLCLFVLAPMYTWAQWIPDILGNGYEMMYVIHPNDYSGSVRSTIIRKSSDPKRNRGVLYIHGYNDYFFQIEMGDRFVEEGYHFYAVDLRKYGRSIMNGQTPFQVRNIREYYADIDSAICEMKRVGIEHIILMGHSTGGLITSLYMAERANFSIMALILNSPFLDWNLGSLEYFIPFVSGIGANLPNISISQGDSKAYAQSLLTGYHGEWSYNIEWKKPQSPNVDCGWIRAIDQAQMKLHNGVNIAVPILLMHSDKTHNVAQWDSLCNETDIVLDINDIKMYGSRLGHNITEMTISGGLHDVMLSDKTIRKEIYRELFNWIELKCHGNVIAVDPRL